MKRTFIPPAPAPGTVTSVKSRRTLTNPGAPGPYAGWDITTTFTGPFKPEARTNNYPIAVTVRNTVYPSNAVSVYWGTLVAPLPNCQGVYVVENGLDVVYAGEAPLGVSGRYRQKARSVQELGLAPDLLAQTQCVWAGAVTAVNTDVFKASAKVESWLIRYLLLADEIANRGAPKLVNIDKTRRGQAPDVGMRLTFVTPVGMDFLWNPLLEDLAGSSVVVQGSTARQSTYEYAPDVEF